jgi:hypothetical protein
MTNLIGGINPLVISKIVAYGGYRHGIHPYMTKVMCKRNPIRGFLGFYESNLFDGFISAKVKIFGSNGKLLQVFEFTSNSGAISYAAELNKQLEDYIGSLKTAL